jgi:hypothetical protein
MKKRFTYKIVFWSWIGTIAMLVLIFFSSCGKNYTNPGEPINGRWYCIENPTPHKAQYDIENPWPSAPVINPGITFMGQQNYQWGDGDYCTIIGLRYRVYIFDLEPNHQPVCRWYYDGVMSDYNKVDSTKFIKYVKP